MLQHVPESIYKAVYPIHLLGLNELREQIFNTGYEIVWEWISPDGQIPILDGKTFVDAIR